MLISPLSFISILLVFIICLYFIDDDKKGEKGLFHMLMMLGLFQMLMMLT